MKEGGLFFESGAWDRAVFVDESERTANGRELGECAGALARELASLGWGPGMSVILVAGFSVDFVVSLLALWRLGIHILLSGPRMFEELGREYGHSVNGVLDPARGPSSPVASRNSLFPFPGPTLSLFTSGSTGIPKLVTLDGQALLERCRIEREIFGLREGVRGLCVMHPSYELGLNQIFSAFHAGSTLVLANPIFPGRILEMIRSLDIHGVIATPQFWINLMQRTDQPRGKASSLAWLSISGGRVNPESFEGIRSLCGSARIFHTYGKTETGRSLFGECGRQLILDRVPSGVEVKLEEGELVHRGFGLGIDVTTGHRFREHRSGDLFAQVPGEGFVFQGRSDNVVKYLDYRICLDEIEATISRFEGVTQSVCVIEKADSRWEGESVLVAYLESKDGVSVAELKAFLHGRLSSYKIPKQFRFVKSWPLTRSLKIDRKRIALGVEYVAAR